MNKTRRSIYKQHVMMIAENWVVQPVVHTAYAALVNNGRKLLKYHISYHLMSELPMKHEHFEPLGVTLISSNRAKSVFM